MALNIRETPVSTTTLAESSEPVADALASGAVAGGVVGLAVPALATMVAGATNQATSSAASALAPRAALSATAASFVAGAVGGARFSGDVGNMSLTQRQDAIAALASSGLTNDKPENRRRLADILWSTPRDERPTLAQFIANSSLNRSIDDALMVGPTGRRGVPSLQAWREFSFFMYEHTAGFGNYYDPPRENGTFAMPTWWYASRFDVSDHFVPQRQYPMPSDAPPEYAQ